MRISPHPIPIPEKNAAQRKNHVKYPLKELKVDGRPLELEYDRKTHYAMYTIVSNFKKNHDKKAKFIIRTSLKENFIRVWRVK